MKKSSALILILLFCNISACNLNSSENNRKIMLPEFNENLHDVYLETEVKTVNDIVYDKNMKPITGIVQTKNGENLIFENFYRNGKMYKEIYYTEKKGILEYDYENNILTSYRNDRSIEATYRCKALMTKTGLDQLFNMPCQVTTYHPFDSSRVKSEYFRKGIKLKDGFPIDNIDGKYIEYDRYGNIVAEKNYKDGYLNGKVIAHDSKMDITCSMEFHNDKKDGPYQCYYANRTKVIEGKYANGKKEGKEQGFSHNGKLMYEKTYKNGWIDGEGKAYNSLGRLICKCNFKRGEIISCHEFDYNNNAKPKKMDITPEIYMLFSLSDEDIGRAQSFNLNSV